MLPCCILECDSLSPSLSNLNEQCYLYTINLYNDLYTNEVSKTERESLFIYLNKFYFNHILPHNMFLNHYVHLTQSNLN